MSAVLVVHGGAWAIPDELAKASVDGVKTAAREGFSVLKRGGSAVDAVEVAVRSLEDNTVFDAGTDGFAQCCEIYLMFQLCLTYFLPQTSHVMLTSQGANLFAESIGISTVPTETLVTEYERREWEKHKNYMTGVIEDFNTQWAHDTVGAVALDSAGNVACATSTGGIRNKMVGRVGDSPVIGCGGYADNLNGAVSCTGHGESILKVTLARLILSKIEQGKSVTEASQMSLQHMGDRVKGAGGAIVVSPSGHWAATFTTERMAWAAVEQDVLWYGLDPHERLKEQLPQ
ncbi:isoaspartyl peptidase/L-asparaginase [Neolamprologus brichardi]|uniref:isoaspartyl peptidase/L-asparaginase n=1 Tax=Neolamprologus brichardi TaxID=32507 RepID=UPI0016438F93|nr:isoaspartyl peptidase/L-asparaginase [Neolamprologus brichardi]